MERAFKVKKYIFFIISKELELKEIKQFFGRWELDLNQVVTRIIPWIAITVNLIYWFQIKWFVICKEG